jgi:hypothetical protein
MVARAMLKQVFSEGFGFPCPSFVPPIAPHSSPSIVQGYFSWSINGLNILVLPPRIQRQRENTLNTTVYKVAVGVVRPFNL